MKDNSGNIKQFNTEDIQRYVRGEMTDQEMHAIEKAALEDQFLSDAIEGYAEAINHSGTEMIDASSKELNERLNQRINSKDRKNTAPVFRMKWWQGAVAASIIITAGVLGYRSYNDRSASVILTSTKEPGKIPSMEPVAESGTLNGDTGSSPGVTTSSADDDTATGNTSSETSAQPVPQDRGQIENGSSRQIPRKEENKSASARAYKELGPGRGEKELASTRPPESSALYLQENNERAIDRDSLNAPRLQPLDQVLQGKAAGVVVEKQKSFAKKNSTDRAGAPVVAEDRVKVDKDSDVSKNEIAKSKVLNGEVISSSQSPVAYYKGQIVTTDNQPLSNAVLTVASTNASYMTDNNGRFVIPSRDSSIDVKVTLVGSPSTSFRLQSNTLSNQLVMPTATSEMAEVVVVGYGTARKRDITGSVTVVKKTAEPEGGWIAFEEYLEKNKDTTLLLKGSGETQVNFLVSSRNRLSDFKITRSISPEHDKEIIRLIQTGPKWKILKGRKANVTVTARF